MNLGPEDLIQQLATGLDPHLARSAIESYVEMQQRFLAGDWKPTELDGGRLCEAVSRCLLQLDTGLVSHTKLPAAIRTVLLDTNKSHTLGLKDREHIAKIIEVVYKFRSDRGAVHISPVHSANQMDAMLVVHAGKWLLAELLRLAWSQDRRVVGEVISQLVQLEHSLIHELDGKPMVLAVKITVPEEILLLLNHAPGNRLSRPEIRNFATSRKASAISTAISRLLAGREVRVADDGAIAMTPNGQKRVIESVLPKYAVH